MRACHQLSRHRFVRVGVREVGEGVILRCRGGVASVVVRGVRADGCLRVGSDEVCAAVASGEAFADDLRAEGEVRGASGAAEVGGVAGEVGL